VRAETPSCQAILYIWTIILLLIIVKMGGPFLIDQFVVIKRLFVGGGHL
jgi:hypothetical protein